VITRLTSLVASLLAVLAVPLLTGCEQTSTPPTGRNGIVSLGPNITETLFELGLGERVIGVTEFCDFPPQVASIAKVGGYSNPNFEKISLLRPAAIVLQGNPPEIVALANRNGFSVISCNMDNLATIDSGIATIGKAFQCESVAAALQTRIKNELDAIRAAVKDLPTRKVLIVNMRQDHTLDTLFTVGGPSFLSELLDIAGGENIFNDEKAAYFEASKETVVLRNPDVIIEFHAGEKLSHDDETAFIADWNAMPGLSAVQKKDIHLFMESYGLRPGPRVPLIARQFAAWLHPDAKLPSTK
jgi:iron complex transport system substrate-binding protein